MRAPEFEAMLAPAKLYPELWRLLLGVAVIVFCYFGFVCILAVAAFPILGPLEYFGFIQSLATPTTPVQTAALLLTFVGMAVGPVLAAGACHLRGAGTIFGPAGETLRGFLTVLAVAGPFYLALLAVGTIFQPVVDNLPWDTWARWIPAALALVLLQVTAEEMLFRGYLQQQLAARFHARWVWMGLPAAIFAALHWNPSTGNVVWLVLLTTFVFGLIAADLTERTGSLGAAIGFHFVNNVAGITLVAMQGTITGLARWTTSYGIEEAGLLAMSLGLNVAFIAVVWRACIRALDR